jgi:molybdate transport system substrate-binding protein
MRKTKPTRIMHNAIVASVVVLMGWGVLFPLLAFGEELTIAAASDLSFAFKDLAADFEKKTGTKVKLSLGSSGNLFSQIENGAPFDMYFSADSRYPQKLEQSGHAVPGSFYRYAVGRIVLWAPNGAKLDVQKGLETLLDPSVRKIAIANPKHAPYGRAAVAAMERSKVYERVKDKLVFGENISQTAQFIESGACDTGIIALSLAVAPSMKSSGQYWEVPADSHPPLEQGAVILKRSQHHEAAKKFFEFMKGPDGQKIMNRYGFTVPA